MDTLRMFQQWNVLKTVLMDSLQIKQIILVCKIVTLYLQMMNSIYVLIFVQMEHQQIQTVINVSNSVYMDNSNKIKYVKQHVQMVYLLII